MASAGPEATICDRCACDLTGALYEIRSPVGRLACCLRCALMYRPLVVRSFLVCLVVGTILTAINQGNVILGGDLPIALAWKIPLTYAVPYCVATFGAILNARSQAPVV